jgi:4-hydroxyphenylpyruvate dioxygenase
MADQNPLRLKSIHHVELYVGNAKQAAYYYRHAFGFSQFAYAGLETGQRDRASYALQQGKARLVLTSPLADGPIGEHLRAHGDGVKDIAFHVEDASVAFDAAVARGATPVQPPRDLSDAHGTVRHAAVATYGDTIHSFISKAAYDGPFLPGYASREVPAAREVGLLRIDHMVGNVELGRMNHWAEWYTRVLGFARYISFDDKDISTEYSALMSIVMSDNSYAIKFPINEPAQGKRKSQIQEYLDFHGGPGVQHVALLTGDIVSTIRALRAGGVEFLSVPDSYYDALPSRVGEIDEAIQTIRDLRILVDRDEEGYLLQLFTKPVEDRPTLFFEIIQRKGSRGFGKGNFKALFEAIEREQALRGNL